MPAPTITLSRPAISPSSNDELRLHLMPFHISYSGPTSFSRLNIRPARPEVLNGGVATESGDKSTKEVEILESSFRGRQMHGVDVKLPAGFEGLVVDIPAVEDFGTPSDPAYGTRPIELDQSGPNNANGRRTSPRKHKASLSKVAGKPKVKLSKLLAEKRAGKGKGKDRSEKVFILEDEDAEEDRAEAEAEKAKVLAEEVDDEMEAARSSTGDAESNAGDPVPLVGVDIEMEVPKEENGFQDHLPPPTKPSSTRDLTAFSKFSSMVVWAPDTGLPDRGDDIFLRSLDEWIAISEVMHAC